MEETRTTDMLIYWIELYVAFTFIYLVSVDVESTGVSPHGRRGGGLERQRDDLVVEGREHGFVVALDYDQRSDNALHQEVLVVQEPGLKHWRRNPPHRLFIIISS